MHRWCCRRNRKRPRRCHFHRIHRTHRAQHMSHRRLWPNRCSCKHPSRCSLPPRTDHTRHRRQHPLSTRLYNRSLQRPAFLHSRNRPLECLNSRNHKCHQGHCKRHTRPMNPHNRLHHRKCHPRRHPLCMRRRIHPRHRGNHKNRRLPLPLNRNCTLIHPYNPIRRVSYSLCRALHLMHSRILQLHRAIEYSSRTSHDLGFHRHRLRR